jgi:site-specific DNA-methyltransferase (adenine-specific)
MQTNVIYNRNCLDGMKELPDACIDLTVTSPPYDGLRQYKGYSFDFENIAQELFRVMKPGGVVVWVVGDQTKDGSESGTSFRQALYFREIGFRLHDTMIYQKANYIPLTHNRYEQEFEYMFILSKGKPKTFDPIKIKTVGNGTEYGLARKVGSVKEASVRRRDENLVTNEWRIKGNVWCYGVGSVRLGHPAPFPEQLAEDHIKSWSQEGDLVLDPFTGSGTTAKACLLLNRKFVGYEISHEYCEIAEKRIAYLRNQTTIFDDFKP